jgi:uncharacterized repeat protein (TIGR03899 family)
MEIKDLAGLSQPLTKLVEVLSSGIGQFSEPMLIRKRADAKAYEIDTIAQAIRRNLTLVGSLEYKDQSVTVLGKEETKTEITPEKEIEEKLLSRIVYQEIKRQQNIEQIAQIAAEQLKNEKEVSDEKLDEDWISRFFNIAEEITSEEMQTLWGRVLAGEVKRPKSYSVRTLEFLRNMSKEEANIFLRVSQLSISNDKTSIIPTMDNQYYLEKFGVSFNDILILQEIGLLNPRDLGYTIYENKNKGKGATWLFNGTKCVIVIKEPGVPQKTIPATVYTNIGRELLSLIEIKPDEEYLEKFAKLWLDEGITVEIGDVITKNPYQIGNTRKIEKDK